MNYTAKVISVIETTLQTRGDGKSPTSPIRCITQYWSPEGKLLAEVDPGVNIALTPEVREQIYAVIEREIFSGTIPSPDVFFETLSGVIDLREDGRG